MPKKNVQKMPVNDFLNLQSVLVKIEKKKIFQEEAPSVSLRYKVYGSDVKEINYLKFDINYLSLYKMCIVII
jgi:hypothetical protein